jgi:hypothetical protein
VKRPGACREKRNAQPDCLGRGDPPGGHCRRLGLADRHQRSVCGRRPGIGWASPGRAGDDRPFRPLIESTTTTTGGTTTTTGGTTTTTGDGTTTTTAGDGATTTTEGFEPETRRVVLLEIRDEDGTRKAVVTVDGETYIVAVGETFAENFKVVSLSENNGVFLFGDSAFTLAVGQAILK